MVNHPVDKAKGRVCGVCYQRLTNPVGRCAECGEEKRLPSNHPSDKSKGRICSACYKRLRSRIVSG